jgi:transcriptional regulator with XRE-family HTH domain
MTRPTPLPALPDCPAEDALRDPERLAALDRTGLLDSPAEQAFDRLTRATQSLLNVPVALVSLITDDRQFFKSAQGLPEPWASLRQTPLSHSFCRIVAAGAETLTIRDAREDDRVRGNLAIRDIGVIAYLGVPLAVEDGRHTVGALCAIDTKPRSWSEDEVQALLDLRAVAVAEIERRSGADRSADAPGSEDPPADMAAWLGRRRRERGLSLGALALKSGVNKSSLSRWESGIRARPHAVELDAVLQALGADDPERLCVHVALGNASEAKRLWEEMWKDGGASSSGAAPSLALPGDVLRGMRQRAGLSQSALAGRLGAGQGSVAKWESTEEWPDMERTLTLCVELSASPREADLLLGWCAARALGWRLPCDPATPPSAVS